MPTGDKVINVFIKKLLSKTDLKDRLVQFMQDRNDEVIAALFSGRSGVLDQDEITLSNGSSGVGYVKATTTNARKLVTGDGHIVTLPASPTVPLTDDVPFENTGSIPYYFAVRYAQPVAQEVEINERTGQPEYPALEESYGELGTPASVADTPGVQISINIDNLLEAGVDHGGRAVTVYLVNPVSGLAATAFFNGQVTYGGGNNTVVISYSGANGPLGQDTSVNPPSTTAADYVVHVRGLSWKRNSDLRLDSDYAFLGVVTGGAPPTFDHTDQLSIFINDLDFAYDGLSGSGSGSRINADSGAVHVRSADSNDGRNEASGNPTGYRTTMLLDRSNSTEAQSVGHTTVADEGDGANVLHLVPLVETSGPQLQLLEPCTTNAGVGSLTFTRATPPRAPATAGAGAYDLALLTGFTGGAAVLNGLHMINAIGDTTVSIIEIETGAAMSSGWPGAGSTGQITILRARFKVGNTRWGLVPGTNARFGPVGVIQGGNLASDEPVFGIVPNAHSKGLALFNDNTLPDAPLYSNHRGGLVGAPFGAMEATQSNASETFNSPTLIEKADNGDWMQFCQTVIGGDVSAIPFAAFQILRGTGLSQSFTCDQTGTQGITITTGGTNLLTAGLDFQDFAKLGAILWLRTGTDKGFYVIKDTPITGTTFEVMPLGSSTAPGVWSTETGLSGSILIPRFMHANSYLHQAGFSGLSGLVHIAREGQGVVKPFRIYPMKAGSSDRIAEIYREGGIDDDALALSMDAEGVMQLGRVSSNPGTIPDVQAGLFIRPRAKGGADKWALNVKHAVCRLLEDTLPSHRAIGLFGSQADSEVSRWAAAGYWAESNRFIERFHFVDQGAITASGYHGGDRWYLSSTPPAGPAAIRWNGSFIGDNYAGLVKITTDASQSNSGALMRGPGIFYPRTSLDKYRAINVRGAFRIKSPMTNMKFYIGCGVGGILNQRSFGVRYVTGGSVGTVEPYVADGTTTIVSFGYTPTAASGDPGDAGDGIVKFWCRINLQGNNMASWLSFASSINNSNIPSNTATLWRGVLYPFIQLENTTTQSIEVEVFHLECWDEDIDTLNGPKQ